MTNDLLSSALTSFLYCFLFENYLSFRVFEKEMSKRNWMGGSRKRILEARKQLHSSSLPNLLDQAGERTPLLEDGRTEADESSDLKGHRSPGELAFACIQRQKQPRTHSHGAVFSPNTLGSQDLVMLAMPLELEPFSSSSDEQELDLGLTREAAVPIIKKHEQEEEEGTSLFQQFRLPPTERFVCERRARFFE